MDTLDAFCLGGSPFILVVAQKVSTFFGPVTGQVSSAVLIRQFPPFLLFVFFLRLSPSFFLCVCVFVSSLFLCLAEGSTLDSVLTRTSHASGPPSWPTWRATSSSARRPRARTRGRWAKRWAKETRVYLCIYIYIICIICIYVYMAILPFRAPQRSGPRKPSGNAEYAAEGKP